MTWVQIPNTELLEIAREFQATRKVAVYIEAEPGHDNIVSFHSYDQNYHDRVIDLFMMFVNKDYPHFEIRFVSRDHRKVWESPYEDLRFTSGVVARREITGISTEKMTSTWDSNGGRPIITGYESDMFR